MAFRTNKTPVLQTKSASGAVATFNTALAMPLPSCNIAVNAWQEGTGDPSPSNVRPIHGFSEVNVNANAVVHTIQLGQEVYGAEVDVVNGVAHCTHQYWECDDSDISNWTTTSTIGRYERRRPSTVNQTSSAMWALGFKSNICQTENRSSSSGATLNNSFYAGSSYLDVRFDSCPTLSDFEALLASEGLQIVSPLLTPFDIQLTPTQIETIRGNNTIFADAGDVDLTYKDLDIAKRGSFREVFKLPS